MADVIVQQKNTSTKHSAPLDPDGSSQFLQSFAVVLTIHCLTSSKEVDEENALSVSEYRAHHFPGRQRLLEFRIAGGSTVTPMH